MTEQVHALNITGMACEACSERVTRVLEATPGVLKADISHKTNSGRVVANSSEITATQLVEIVKSSGFEASA